MFRDKSISLLFDKRMTMHMRGKKSAVEIKVTVNRANPTRVTGNTQGREGERTGEGGADKPPREKKNPVMNYCFEVKDNLLNLVTSHFYLLCHIFGFIAMFEYLINF